jgi:hypothetical protein
LHGWLYFFSEIYYLKWSLFHGFTHDLVLNTIIADGSLLPLCGRHLELGGILLCKYLFSLRGESLSQLGDTVVRSNFLI